jgi:hypothetical protein
MKLHYFRHSVPLIILILYIYNYYSDVFNYSDKKECYTYLPFKCSKIFTGITLTLVMLEILYLFYINKQKILHESLPKIWPFILLLILLFIIRLISESSPGIPNNGKYYAMPNKILKRDKRIVLITVIIIILLLSFLFEGFMTLDGNYTKIGIQTHLFGGFHGDNIMYYIFAVLKIVSVLLLLLYRRAYINFNACQYELPVNWSN